MLVAKKKKKKNRNKGLGGKGELRVMKRQSIPNSGWLGPPGMAWGRTESVEAHGALADGEGDHLLHTHSSRQIGMQTL